MKRLNLLVTRIKTYVELLQVQLKLYSPGTQEHTLIKTELDTLEAQLEFMLSIEDHMDIQKANRPHLRLIK